MERMNPADILYRIDKLAIWTSASERAPHKPLLILYALGRVQRGESPEVSYRQLEGILTKLLREFGPARTTHHPDYPFCRLRTSGLWRVDSDRPMSSGKSNSDIPKSELIGANARGRFTDAVLEALDLDPSLVAQIAQRLLDGHFAETYHSDILDAVGLSVESQIVGRRRRDPNFRASVLTAYEYRCAVCQLDLRLGMTTVGLEAAHIKWYQAGGPDVESNGLALCSLHHKMFDRGVFTVDSPAWLILVSEEATGPEILSMPSCVITRGLSAYLIAPTLDRTVSTSHGIARKSFGQSRGTSRTNSIVIYVPPTRLVPPKAYSGVRENSEKPSAHGTTVDQIW